MTNGSTDRDGKRLHAVLLCQEQRHLLQHRELCWNQALVSTRTYY